MAKATIKVVPFIGDSNLRSIKKDHNYTLNEVSELSLKELTELALLIPDLLQPEGWNFVYSFADGDIVTKAARPTTFIAPSDDVIEAIKQRVLAEGYQMFVTVRNYYLFLEWDEFVGCLNESSFLRNVKKRVSCYNVEREIFWTPDLGYCKEEFCFELYATKLVAID